MFFTSSFLLLVVRHLLLVAWHLLLVASWLLPFAYWKDQHPQITTKEIEREWSSRVSPVVEVSEIEQPSSRSRFLLLVCSHM